MHGFVSGEWFSSSPSVRYKWFNMHEPLWYVGSCRSVFIFFVKTTCKFNCLNLWLSLLAKKTKLCVLNLEQQRTMYKTWGLFQWVFAAFQIQWSLQNWVLLSNENNLGGRKETYRGSELQSLWCFREQDRSGMFDYRKGGLFMYIGVR